MLGSLHRCSPRVLSSTSRGSGRSPHLSLSLSLTRSSVVMGITRGRLPWIFVNIYSTRTIKWSMNYGGSAEKCGTGKDRGHVATRGTPNAVKFITRSSETDHRPTPTVETLPFDIDMIDVVDQQQKQISEFSRFRRFKCEIFANIIMKRESRCAMRGGFCALQYFARL